MVGDSLSGARFYNDVFLITVCDRQYVSTVLSLPIGLG